MAKKKRKVRNKARDVFTDYYRTNKQYAKENRERQAQEEQPKGLKNLTFTEKTYITIIVLGLIGIFIRYVIFR